MQRVIDQLPHSLTYEQREQPIALIRRNTDVFSKHEFVVGSTNLLTSRIVAGHHRPVAEPVIRHARVHLDVIDDIK